MSENRAYLPEGWHEFPRLSLEQLRLAALNGDIIRGTVVRCSSDCTLTVSLGNVQGHIPREEAVAPWISGANRDISILSMVGKQISFTVKSIDSDEKGAPTLLLSRREAQEKTMEFFLGALRPGMILACKVTHLTHFGAFLDIGCGIVAMLPIELISISRLTHTAERFQKGQKILAVVNNVDSQTRRITMTPGELLGTWMENASLFSVGDTVEGVVRSVKEYGSFIELTPNLSGLAENRIALAPGNRVSVYIKNIRPEQMKIKLQIIEKLPPLNMPRELNYHITSGYLDHWIYSPSNCEKEVVETIFTASDP